MENLTLIEHLGTPIWFVCFNPIIIPTYTTKSELSNAVASDGIRVKKGGAGTERAHRAWSHVVFMVGVGPIKQHSS